ncbi:putative ABC transporter-binding protein precursor [Sporomusa ovata DSM 2662]|uniref:Maltose/maltodextrin ABC transporter, substrate binding periplasmic protein MalE n=1 Tax=Sporomusa ovata TaxID=2378 RepID=A0A0U1KUC0_9FIRM|nr:extracellular solute-binding protein [Sporomusa ovata]EQB26939.1 maltose/maltodextrin ABC transporter, substrate binding periplasmic protein MalE [Sporomusa ovata DSM 2662]CQR71041.1 Maltose/maltodextrin ABC transporter, substrate binding periplasmic protein MalE [Sporomusa ovata]
MKIRTLLLLSMVSLVAVFLISCSGKRQSISEESTYKKQQLSFRITWTAYSGRGEAIQKIVDLYNEKNNDGFEIVLHGGDENVKAIEGFLAEKSSETIYVLPYRFVKYFGDKGYLEDLSVSFQKEEELFYPELWQLGEINGGIYGIPWVGHSICLIYNKDLLKKAGVDAASIKDLDSLLKAFKAVEEKTNVKGIGLVGANHNDISWMVNQFIYGYGSNLVDTSGTKVAINNEKAKAAILFYKNVLGKHAQPSWITDTGVEVLEHFRKQKIAFEFQGVWGVADNEKHGNPFPVGIISLETIGLCPEVGSMMLSIPSGMSNEKKAAAIKFLKFMISKEAQEKIMDGEYSPEHDTYYPFRVPVRKDLSDSFIFEKYPQYLPFLRGFKRPSIDVPVPKWQTIKDGYYAPGLHRVMKEEMSVDEFLERIEVEGNKILIK